MKNLVEIHIPSSFVEFCLPDSMTAIRLGAWKEKVYAGRVRIDENGQSKTDIQSLPIVGM